MPAINFFASVDHLQPKCPGCNSALDFGVNTEYSDKYEAHVCLNCGHVLREDLDKEIKIEELPEDEP